ncbi:3-phytase [Thozetella sp. PMI_491]|nr:3-phytase [Thozetella sp. PMI_491]
MARLLQAAALLAAVSPAMASSAAAALARDAAAAVNTTTCNGKTYLYEELAGYGYIVNDARDKFGDTLGGLGSGIWMNQTAWTKAADGSYTGTLWALPDRGWNTQGTLNFIPRVHILNVKFTPQPAATVASPSGPNLQLTYVDSIILRGPDGRPGTGLDADGSGSLSFSGFPPLPAATYPGDGYGGPGCAGGKAGGHRVSIDAEGLHVNDDGTFWISDEYGPYIYLFDKSGTMITAIRPPEAIVPKRNGTDSFSSDTTPIYINGGQGDDVSPADNPTGRDNNHGFEGLAVTDNGNTLWVLLQAAANQEGGLSKQTERYSRFLKYDVSNRKSPVYLAEYVVPLPLYVDPTAKPSKNPKTAAQSEIYGLPNGQFFVLSRDSNNGHGAEGTLSNYRQVDVFDISQATDIKAAGGYDCETCAVASSNGVLDSKITPATYCSFLDFNVNSQLNRFGVHNGGNQDQFLLNEKWESIAIVPVEPGSGNNGGEYFLFSLSDNDFITQNGFMKFGKFPYKDASGYSLDSQALVFKIKIPV